MEILRHQPRGRAVLQKTGLGAALVASINPAQYLSEVLNQPIVPSSGVTRVPARHGVAFQHSASNGSVAFGAPGGLNTLVAPGTAFSIFLRVFVSNIATRQMLVADGAAAGNGESFWMEVSATGQWIFRITDSNSQPRTITVAGATVGWHDVLMVHRPGTGNQLYIDGVSVGTVVFTDPLRNGSSLRIGGFGAYALLGFLGRIAACHIFRSDVSEQIRQLIDNPWHLWVAPDDEDDVAASVAPAGTSVTPDSGNVALTGYTPNVQQSAMRSAAPGAAAVTVAGFAPVVSQSAAVDLVPAPSALVVTGYAPAVVRGAAQSASPDSAGLTVAGYAPSITQAANLAPQVYAATIMRATTINRRADLGAPLNLSLALPAAPVNVATIMRATPVNRTAAQGPASINRAVSFP